MGDDQEGLLAKGALFSFAEDREMKGEQGVEIVRLRPEYQPVGQKPIRVAQLNLFTGEPEPLPIRIHTEPAEGEEQVIGEGISMVKSGDSSQVILSGYGLYLSKKSERLLVKSSKKVIYEFPMFRLNEVVVSSRGISLSSDLIEELCQRGIRITFLTSRGMPYAMITSPMLNATIMARRQQLLAFSDQRSLIFSRLVVEGKIKNQEKLLKYFAKYLKKVDPGRFERIQNFVQGLNGVRKKVKGVTGQNIEHGRDSLMGLEGVAGRLYWDGVKEIIAQKVEFFGREHRGATDTVNSLLNYGYGILYGQVCGAILNAGLEPYAGFLHTDRSGKPSLVMDLIEEFRQPVVDRVVIAHINLGEVVKMDKEGRLAEDTKRYFASKVIERLESTETVKGKKYQIRSIIQMQARSLCSFLRGDGNYRPFTFKW
jgi:CRISPR-associated protein Cas1